MTDPSEEAATLDPMPRVESGPDPDGVPRVWTLLSVLMPLYNERRTLRAIVRRVWIARSRSRWS